MFLPQLLPERQFLPPGNLPLLKVCRSHVLKDFNVPDKLGQIVFNQNISKVSVFEFETEVYSTLYTINLCLEEIIITGHYDLRALNADFPSKNKQ